MGELHKIGFDTYRKTESKVKVVIDDGKEVVGITLFFKRHFKMWCMNFTFILLQFSRNVLCCENGINYKSFEFID